MYILVGVAIVFAECGVLFAAFVGSVSKHFGAVHRLLPCTDPKADHQEDSGLHENGAPAAFGFYAR